MIRLDKVSSGGKPIVIKYDVATSTSSYANFKDISFNDGVPPSRYAAGDPNADGGLYDHIIGVVDMPLDSGNVWLSTDLMGISGNHWWTLFAEPAINAVHGTFGGAYVWIVVTDIEYVGYNATSGKIFMHTGLDIYMA